MEHQRNIAIDAKRIRMNISIIPFLAAGDVKTNSLAPVRACGERFVDPYVCLIGR